MAHFTFPARRACVRFAPPITVERTTNMSHLSRSPGALGATIRTVFVGSRRAVSVALALTCVAAASSSAQGRLSEKGIVAQTVGETTITVEYYRPVARGLPEPAAIATVGVA